MFEPTTCSLLEYSEQHKNKVCKLWIVDDHTNFGGAFSPTRLRVERDGGQFRSVMTLVKMALEVPVESALFCPTALAELSTDRYAAALRSLECCE